MIIEPLLSLSNYNNSYILNINILLFNILLVITTST